MLDRLIQAFWPGPLTLILPKNSRVPDLATSGLPTVAVRMPEHPLALALIEKSQRPLAPPSANRFGRISPTSAAAVAEELGERIDWILDGGTCAIGLESTILSVHPTQGTDVRILRAGGTPKERIEEVLGFPILTASVEAAVHLAAREHRPAEVRPAELKHPEAPGMLESHYAPSKPFILLDHPFSKTPDVDLSILFIQLAFTLDQLREAGSTPIGPDFGQTTSPVVSDHPTVGILLLSGPPEAAAARISGLAPFPILVRSLSIQGDLRESAHNLFSEMRWLDSSPASIILVEPCQVKEGLGHAIADRLGKASAGSRRLLGG